ncbi:MAG TPA: GAF domain-containing sensor histidine kinase [Anaerolineales bacterium]|nr:GAF domain-containing sensor histidine kinase [Anaerolineales bacterium]
MTQPTELARENADLRSQIALLARLVEVSVTLSSTLDLRQLLNYIISAAAELLNTEVASIMLYDEQLNELHFAAATGSDPHELAQIPVPLEGSIAGAIFNENKPMIINDVSHDPRHFGGVGEKVNFSSQKLVGVPMRIKDRATGVLEALNKKDGRDFNEADARILAILASQAAVAIENARLVEHIQQAYAELGKLDKMKGDFIAIASHELRTPLGVILGYATFLREEAKGEASEYAKAVLDSAVHMRKLIEDLTNLRFMEVGQMSLQREPVDVRELLAEARKEMLPLADAKAQKIVVHPYDVGLICILDRAKMMVVMTNLLTNAIRFTQDGGLIEVRAFPRAGEVWVQVKDNGRGIHPRDLDNIFQGFFQVEDHMVRKTSGLGIGLSIVRGTVKMHGGRAWADSEGEGRGALFTFTLPLSRPGTGMLTGTKPNAPVGG